MRCVPAPFSPEQACPRFARHFRFQAWLLARRCRPASTVTLVKLRRAVRQDLGSAPSGGSRPLVAVAVEAACRAGWVARAAAVAAWASHGDRARARPQVVLAATGSAC